MGAGGGALVGGAEASQGGGVGGAAGRRRKKKKKENKKSKSWSGQRGRPQTEIYPRPSPRGATTARQSPRG